jgi:hypothetical protein
LPLDSYSTSFTADIRSRLQYWRRCFTQDDVARLIGRNIDRECDRNDVERTGWNEFLHEVAGSVLRDDDVRNSAFLHWCARGQPLGSPDEDWSAAEIELYGDLILDPVSMMDEIVKNRRRHYILRGLSLPDSTCPRLYRYISLRSFWLHNLRKLPFARVAYSGAPALVGLEKLAHCIGAGLINSSATVGTWLGREDYPVWCTNRSLLGALPADEIRNALGLKHIEGGFLVEISYPIDMLTSRGESLRAPTVLDASASADENWIFLKNANPGGPDWGYAARLTDNGVFDQGAPEAVHPPLRIEASDAPTVTLAVTGPISRSGPDVDFKATYLNNRI